MPNQVEPTTHPRLIYPTRQHQVHSSTHPTRRPRPHLHRPLTRARLAQYSASTNRTRQQHPVKTPYSIFTITIIITRLLQPPPPQQQRPTTNTWSSYSNSSNSNTMNRHRVTIAMDRRHLHRRINRTRASSRPQWLSSSRAVAPIWFHPVRWLVAVAVEALLWCSRARKTNKKVRIGIFTNQNSILEIITGDITNS